jgi:pimeloyl-ACP methyl ester carboxylesterase
VLKPILRVAVGRAVAGFDVAVVRIAQELGRRGGGAKQTVDDRLAYLDRVAAAYAEIDAAEFFAPPPVPETVREHFLRELASGSASDVSWTSGWVPRRADIRDRYLRHRENATVHARLFRHVKPAPTIVCVHGYRAGAFPFEERAWAVEWFYRLGLDVALFTLPFHALRAPPTRRTVPLFPTGDVARTIEGFGQATWDLRSLILWLRARGSETVGVAGMSLGGYTTALLATVESNLAFAIPFIPVADMTDVVVEHEALRGTRVPRKLVEAGKRALAIVRPLGRTPTVPGDRVLVVAGEHDRITHPGHAEQLAAHFGAELAKFPGAHLLQFGRREGFGAMARFLARHRIIPGPGGGHAERQGR